MHHGEARQPTAMRQAGHGHVDGPPVVRAEAYRVGRELIGSFRARVCVDSSIRLPTVTTAASATLED